MTARTGSRLPRLTDCLLKVGDISQVQLRAKLVALSSCHSGRGQIKVEGVVGPWRSWVRCTLSVGVTVVACEQVPGEVEKKKRVATPRAKRVGRGGACRHCFQCTVPPLGD